MKNTTNTDQLFRDLQYFTKKRQYKQCIQILDELQEALKSEEVEASEE